jgi:pimeloyl-ACP methyl ester carboxylesterase
MDLMWQSTRFLSGAKVSQPSLYVVGEFDAVLTTYRAHVDALEETMPNLREKVVVPSAGHWIQQERPAAVNERLIEFLAWAHDADFAAG